MKKFFNTWELQNFWQAWLTQATNPAWYISLGFSLFIISLYLLFNNPLILILLLMIPFVFPVYWHTKLTKSLFASIFLGIAAANVITLLLIPTIKVFAIIGLGSLLTFMVLVMQTSTFETEFKYPFFDKLEHFGLYFIITTFIYKMNITNNWLFALLIVLILNILYETKDGLGPILYSKLPEKYKNIDLIKHVLNTDGFSCIDILAGLLGYVCRILIIYFL